MQISENSRVWIYQSDKVLKEDERAQIEQALNNFTAQWQAHGHQLTAKSEIRYNRFIILLVDEAQAGATGCSIDKSVNLMKQFEQQFNINLFDRFNIAYKKGEDIISCSREEFEALLQSGDINEDTIVFNNLAQTKKELDTSWEIAFKNSWHAKIFGRELAKK